MSDRRKAGDLRPVDRLERWLPRWASRLVVWVRSDEALSTAASLAFYGLISIAPATLVAAWAVSAVVGPERLAGTAAQALQWLPADVRVEQTLQQVVDVSTTLGLVSLVAAIWPATAYGAGLARAFSRLTPERQRLFDGLRGRLMGIALIAVWPVVTLVVLAGVLAANSISGEGPVATVLAFVGGGAAGLVIAGAVTAFIFTLFSPVEVGFRPAAWGGTVAALIIAAVTIGYGAYLQLGADFQERYGSSAVGALILLALWLYLVNGALIVGYKAALAKAHVAAFTDRGE